MQGYRELSVVGVELFAIASGAALEHRFRDESDAVARVERLKGEATDVAALELPDGRHELFIVDRNEALCYSVQQPDTLERSRTRAAVTPGRGSAGALRALAPCTSRVCRTAGSDCARTRHTPSCVSGAG